ncbi:hypothetical protein H4Q26_002845 [Puccinia striiformis f. sp. tritici PST-130]|nr:hypothetical protein H4Q26_002845 [Puccinia striiformis f. sp. tritici PST-130]
MSHSPVWYSSINDYKYIKKSISRQSWLAVTGKGGERPQDPSTRENPRVDGASRILIIILRANGEHSISSSLASSIQDLPQLELHTEPYAMTNILLTLLTLSCAILGLRGQALAMQAG